MAAEVESTELVAQRGRRDCTVKVWSAGTRPTSVGSGTAPQPEPVDDVAIHGRPAYWDGRTLQWSYGNDAIAQVTCESRDALGLARTMAERVVFEPTVLRVPLRLGQAPKGYRVTYVAEEDDNGHPAAVWHLTPTDADLAWEIEILVNPGDSNLPRLQDATGHAVERETVTGYPALLDASSGTLDLDAGPYLIRMQFAYGQDSDQWAPGRRRQLVRLAESLKPAPALGDRDTWFDAEKALPS